MTKLSNKSVVKAYFEAFSRGDMEKVLETFHPQCLIVSVKEGSRKNGQLHGSYQTRSEAKEFLKNISDLFITKSFEVESIMSGENEVVYANGTFTHEVKATGKLFYSTWVQRCIIEEGMIKEYRFYEDSAAYEQAAI
ncbi:MAG: nuclear transport factor 2 family protein [bacterium]|nr:nuclear transport factor 2 family protein [bacterium]